jgi:biopolymer transport protein ExbD
MPTTGNLEMRFYVRKRRTTPAVIIVALIDVLIVLVIFLLVTTTFKQQPALRLTLPESSQAKKDGANDKERLEVSIGKDGVLRFGQNADVVTVEQLAGKLRDAVAKSPDVTLAINADEKAPWGKVVKVRDAATEAKIKTLIAYTKEASKP